MCSGQGYVYLDTVNVLPYLLTEQQLRENNFTVDSQEDFRETIPTLHPIPWELEMLGLDCEMVKTHRGFELARVTLVNRECRTIYDKLVKPTCEVIDYLTAYSGITAEILQTVENTFEYVQEELFMIIKRETIIVGHSVENDLRVLRLIHKRVLDTSVIYPHPQPNYKFSLKRLAYRWLNKIIQNVLFKHRVKDTTA